MTNSEAILYYDGKCPLCRKEVYWLRRLRRSGLHLQDVHSAEVSVWQRQQMLRILHLQRADKSWALGVEATVAAWAYTPLGFLFKPLLWPVVAPLANRLYQLWARRRASRLPWLKNEGDSWAQGGK